MYKVKEQNGLMCVCACGCLYFMCVPAWAHVIVCASVHKVCVCMTYVFIC